MQSPTANNQFFNRILNDPSSKVAHLDQSPGHSPLRYQTNQESLPSPSFANSQQSTQQHLLLQPQIRPADQQKHQPQNDQPTSLVLEPSDHYGGIQYQQFNQVCQAGPGAATNNGHYGSSRVSESQYATGSKPTLSSNETKVCVIVDPKAPFIIKVPVPHSQITLADLKRAFPAIDKPNYKYFFKSNDSEFGIVKEEIQEDDCLLPTYRNRVVAWIVKPGHSEVASRMRSETSDTCNMTYSNTSYDYGSSSMMTTDLESTSYFTETDDEDSISCSNYSETTCDTFISQRRNNSNGNVNNNHRSYKPNGNALIMDSHRHRHNRDQGSRGSPYGNHNNNNGGRHNHNRLSKLDNISSSSSPTSVPSESYSDATAVHYETVNIVLTSENFLGLHIYANAVNGRDEGIYVNEVTKNSAVDLDGRIESGDKLIQVNETNLEELTNEESVKVLKDAVVKRGPLKLVVAKFIEANSRNDPIGLSQPVHPIDTAAWVAHAQAVTMPNVVQQHQFEHANSATSSPSFGSNAQDTDCIRPASAGMGRLGSGLRLNRATTDLKDIVDQMQVPQYGLEIKDREWLKIPIPRAFLGSDLLAWLERNVYGWTNEREAKKFASRLLREGYIRDPICKKSFSSKSYYTFVD